MKNFINSNTNSKKAKTLDEIFDSLDEKMNQAIELSQKISPSEKVQNSFWKFFKIVEKK